MADDQADVVIKHAVSGPDDADAEILAEVGVASGGGEEDAGRGGHVGGGHGAGGAGEDGARAAGCAVRACGVVIGGTEGNEFDLVVAAGRADGHGGVEAHLVGDARRQRLSGGAHGGGEASTAIVDVIGLGSVGGGEGRGDRPGDRFVEETAVVRAETGCGSDPLAARGHGVVIETVDHQTFETFRENNPGGGGDDGESNARQRKGGKARCGVNSIPDHCDWGLFGTGG